MADTASGPPSRLSDPLPHTGSGRTISGSPSSEADHAEIELFRRDKGGLGNLLEALYSENPYRLNILSVLISGLIATIAFTAVWYGIYFGYGNESTDLCFILGSVIVPQATDPKNIGDSVGWLARIIGIGIHLVVGIGIASAYAVILMVIKQQSNAGKGMIFGVGIGTAMMAFALPFYVGLLARFHPAHIAFDSPDVALNQLGTGNLGWGPMTVAILAHVTFGYLLGSFYRHKVSMETVTDATAPEDFNPVAGGVAHGH